MPDVFKTICGQCGGYCCRNYEIFLTDSEIKKIKKSGRRFKYKKEGAGFLMGNSDGCKFLDNKTGCKLPSRLKAFDCNLFPLAFIYKQEKFEFYLLKECAYYKKIPKIKIKQMKKQALAKLKGWSHAEIKTYSQLIKARPKSDLLKV